MNHSLCCSVSLGMRRRGTGLTRVCSRGHFKLENVHGRRSSGEGAVVSWRLGSEGLTEILFPFTCIASVLEVSGGGAPQGSERRMFPSRGACVQVVEPGETRASESDGSWAL